MWKAGSFDQSGCFSLVSDAEFKQTFSQLILLGAYSAIADQVCIISSLDITRSDTEEVEVPAGLLVDQQTFQQSSARKFLHPVAGIDLWRRSKVVFCFNQMISIGGGRLFW